MLMDNQELRHDFAQRVPAHLSAAKPKDRVKLFLAVAVVVLSVAVLFESFALAVISSNYYGIFESVDYDEEEVSDEDDSGFYEESTEEEE